MDLHEIFSEGWQWVDEQTLNLGGDPDHRRYTGIVFGFVTIGRYGKNANG